MSFADDKLYSGYLRRNMAAIVTRVRVREIIVHLPCLTQHDREIIEAKRETCGNYNAMTLLLDCLKRRENWPEQFICALEACEQQAMAAEIRAEYDTLRGINNPISSSPPTTVTRAHVHPAPAAVAPPPAEPPVHVPSPLKVPAQPQAPQIPTSSPEPVPKPSQSTPPSTPPPSPETPRPPVTTPPAPQKESTGPLEPEENSESDTQDVSDNEGISPDHVSSVNDEVSVNSVATPDALSHRYVQATSTIECRPPQSYSPVCKKLDATDGPSTPMLTPEKPPVQDTMPPVNKASVAVQQPEEMSEPPLIQDIASRPQTETAATASTLPAAAAAAAAAGSDPLHYEDSVCPSKPGQLLSIHPQNLADHTNPALSHPPEPYSGNSDRLEISEAAPATETSVPLCCPVSSNAVSTDPLAPCVENGIALDHNEPEENHYESLGQSLDVQENVVHVAEEPSMLNLDGQSSPTQVNGEAPKVATSVPPAAAPADIGSSLNHPSSAPVSADTAQELKRLQVSEKAAPRTLPANTKYVLTAAGVGACALLIAWRFKN